MITMGEFLLGKLSRDPASGDYLNARYESTHNDVNASMRVIKEQFPGFEELIAGREVLDIGCGEGMESLALLNLDAKSVHGIDIHIDPERNAKVVVAAPTEHLKFSIMDASNLAFPDGSFDVVVTRGSFEHFNDPFVVLREVVRVLRDDGLIFLTSGVWAHPYGAHMNFFTKVPWVQYMFSEKTIMNVRRKYRSDGATRFCDVPGGLNKVGIRSFLRMTRRLELEVSYLRLNPVKNLVFLTRIPYINELFTNLIIAILKKGENHFSGAPN